MKIGHIDFGSERIECEDTDRVAKQFNMYSKTSIEELVREVNNNLNVQEGKRINEIEYISKDDNRNECEIDIYYNRYSKIKKLIRNIKVGNDKENKLILETFRNNFDIIKDTLLDFINKSVSESIVPNKWMVATIFSISKIAGTDKATNYRPINILPVYAKILESVVKEEVIEYFEGKDILIDKQAAHRGKARVK